MILVPQTPTPLPPIPDIPPIPMGFVPPWVPYIAALGIIAGVLILIPIVRALARRIEGKGGSDEMRAEIDGLHQRVAELEAVEQRMHELENRMEFSERLLTQHRESALERGGKS
ncbi:MAG TPA: hypothetical protein VJU15_13250 [Gemmatimonadales bacterium]|nr:hypothetical protein [Gemmatimonadales bacterium]